MYFASSKFLMWLKIDDPLEAANVHGFCGVWAMLAAAIFSTRVNINEAYHSAAQSDDWLNMNVFERLGIQLLACVILILWTTTLSALTFIALKYTIGLRVSEEVNKSYLSFVFESRKFGYHRNSRSIPSLLDPPSLEIPHFEKVSEDVQLQNRFHSKFVSLKSFMTSFLNTDFISVLASSHIIDIKMS